MFEPAFAGGGDIPNDIWKKIKRLSTYFKNEVAEEGGRFNLSPHVLRIFQPCNALAILDNEHIYFAFSEINAGGMPRKNWKDMRQQGTLTFDDFRALAIQEASLVNPLVLSFGSDIIDKPEDKQIAAARDIARRYVQEINDDLTRLPLPKGYEYLRSNVDKFCNDHPEYEKNVFIGMRFRTEPHFGEIHKAISGTLSKYGLKGLRADDKIYPDDDDLWDNVCTYMIGCKYGVFVFEDIEEREFNPNVPLEYGFMRGLNKRVLLLKEKRLPKMPSDVVGKLYKLFDMFNIGQTIEEQIERWVKTDLGIAG